MSTLNVPHSFSAATTIESAKVNANFDAIETVVNGGLDTNNLSGSAGITSAQLADGTIVAGDLSAALLSSLGGAGSRGKCIIATEEARTNTAYGTLTTPDQVTGIVLPTDGLIVVGYQAMWKSSVAQVGRAAIHVGATQLKGALDNANSPGVTEALTRSGGGNYELLFSAGSGISSAAFPSNYTGDVTTGQVIGSQVGTLGYNSSAPGVFYLPGGPCYIFAAAGTYTISIMFKSSSGSVTAKGRKLWVWTESF